MPRILTLQHLRVEGLGTIEPELAARGLTPEIIRIDQGEPVPGKIGDAAGLIVMGGPQSVCDQKKHPHLAEEIRLIESALERDVPVLGVCLGSQLLAAALGAEVRPGPQKEIGWYPVQLAGAAAADSLFAGVRSPFTAFHWHGDIFDLPAGATALASSGLTAVQGFRHGERAWGLLFHLEISERQVIDMLSVLYEEVEAAGLPAHRIANGCADHLERVNEIAATVFGRFAALCAGG